MTIRQASHANSWYTGDGHKLDVELTSLLSRVEPSPGSDYDPPIKGCKAIIAPHAGYSYSGPAAAWAYKSIETSVIKRVFILGPSHHYYLDGCALSKCTEYETPLGNLPLDLETINELRETGKFQDMTIDADEAEHSIEMHLPYVRKMFEGLEVAIVPILVGSINNAKEAQMGKLLAPHLARPDTFCVISSDFCHWGSRFSYTYYRSPEDGSAVHLNRHNSGSPVLENHPIHASITALDQEAMSVLSVGEHSAQEAHDKFSEYLGRTRNTICGRHPIGVLLGALSALEEVGRRASVKWVRYEQSSKCFTVKDSSVSYASGYATF